MSINHEDYTIEELMGPINHGLTMGNNMNAANFAFELLCDKLNVDRDELVYYPHWARKDLPYQYFPFTISLQPGQCRQLKPHGILYRCIECGTHVIDHEGGKDQPFAIPDHECQRREWRMKADE